MNRARHATLAALLAVIGLFHTSSVSAQAQTVGGFQSASEVRVTRTVSDFTSRATLTTDGGALAGATATPTSLSPATMILEGSVPFGPVGTGGMVVSKDTLLAMKRIAGRPQDLADIERLKEP